MEIISHRTKPLVGVRYHFLRDIINVYKLPSKYTRKLLQILHVYTILTTKKSKYKLSNYYLLHSNPIPSIQLGVKLECPENQALSPYTCIIFMIWYNINGGTR